MNYKNYLIACSLIFIFSCKKNSTNGSAPKDSLQKKEAEIEFSNDSETSQNALDWEGIYEGVFNCVDCNKLKTTITLHPNNTYVYKNQKMKEVGFFLWSEDKSKITLARIGKKFIVGENRLIALDDEWKPLKDKDNNSVSFEKKDVKMVFEVDKNTTNKEIANKIKTYLRNKYKEDLKQKVLSDLDREFSFYELDLNGDGKNEYFVRLNGPENCGSGGCTFNLLNNDFTLNTVFTVSNPPFFRSSTKTNGWNDIIMYGNRNKKGELTYIHLKYNTKTKSYPSNPTVVIASKNAPTEHDLGLWNDEFGFATTFSF